MYQNCNSSSNGCLSGYTCDKLVNTCRIPQNKESCLPRNGSSFGCDTGYLCKNLFCALPNEGELCDSSVGCDLGYICDTFTIQCRKPVEAEVCSPGNNPLEGCTKGLQCINYHLSARVANKTGNLLAKFFTLPANTSFLPNFDSLLPYLTSYTSEIRFDGTKEFGAVFEGNLRFPSNGTWTLYINSSNVGYQLVADGTQLINSTGDLAETSNPIYITQMNETKRIRLECFSKSAISSIHLFWSKPDNLEKSQILSNSWELDREYTCSKPFLNDSCTAPNGCFDGLYCKGITAVSGGSITEICMVRLSILQNLNRIGILLIFF